MPVVKSKYAEDWNISFDDLKRKVFSVNVYYDKLEYVIYTLELTGEVAVVKDFLYA